MRLFSILFICVLSSCSMRKVSVFVEVYHPYCGGAKPTPEVARGVKTPFKGEKVAVYRMNDDLKSSRFNKWIQLDSTGNWNGKLKMGSYNIFRADKMLSVEEIEKKYRKPDNEMYAFVGLEILTAWKATPDFTVEVKENSEVKIELTEKCFVGLNPCMKYIGPKPR